MSRLRHEKSRQHSLAGAGSGVHRSAVGKPLPFKAEEERKCGGKIEGRKEHHKLGRKRGGSCNGTDATPDRGMKYGTKLEDGDKMARGGCAKRPKKRADGGGATNSDNNGGWQTKTEDSNTPIGESLGRLNGLQASMGQLQRDIDSAKSKAQVTPSRAHGGWIKSAIKHPGAETRAANRAGESTHEYMEEHKHASGKAGARARLGLRLSAMSKHKKD